MHVKWFPQLPILTVLILAMAACSNSQPAADIDGVVQSRPNDVVQGTPHRTKGDEVATTPTVPKQKGFQNCLTLADKLTTLPLSPKNLMSPKDTDIPENSKIIAIYEIVDYSGKRLPSLENPVTTLVCKAKAKFPQGIYPIKFYLMRENKFEYIVLESQGKRKWLFKWEVTTH